MTTLDVTDFDLLHEPDLENLASLPDEQVEELKARFRIEVDAQATWAMRKARAAALRLKDIDDIAAAEIERIQEWALRERRKPDRELNFFTGLLTDYALQVRAMDEKRKSIVTPYGKVATRKADPSVVVEDPDAFVDWARDHAPTLVAIVEKPESLAEIRKVVQATEDGFAMTAGGELVKGLAVKPGGVTATVTPDVTS